MEVSMLLILSVLAFTARPVAAPLMKEQGGGGGAASAPALRAGRIILRVSDLQKSLAFYRDQVGLSVQSATPEFAVLDGGGGVVVMLNQVSTAKPSSGLAALTEIVLETPDIMATYERMKARGVAFKIAPRVVTTDGVRDMLACDFRDPDEHVLSIAGWAARGK
ncbi:MAG TPA: VOC family protein [Vicinamibacterales bacterium]|jgi:catechol 2,3-dioxygenase-like lactoylglutathione lyase family enzyme